MEIPEFAQVDIFDLYTYFIPGCFALILLGLIIPTEIAIWAVGRQPNILLQVSFIIVAYILGVLVHQAARTIEEGYCSHYTSDINNKSGTNVNIDNFTKDYIYPMIKWIKLFPRIPQECLGVSGIARFHLPGIIWLSNMYEYSKNTDSKDVDTKIILFGNTPAQKGFKEVSDEEKFNRSEYIDALIEMRSEMSTGEYYPFHKPAARGELLLSAWLLFLLIILLEAMSITNQLILVILDVLKVGPLVSYRSHWSALMDAYLPDFPDPIISVSILIAAILLAQLSSRMREYEQEQMIRQLAADYYYKHTKES